MSTPTAEEVREMFRRIGIPQAELARLAGVSYATLHAWANGRRQPSARSLRKIADGLERHGGELRSIAAELRTMAREHDH